MEDLIKYYYGTYGQRIKLERYNWTANTRAAIFVRNLVTKL